MAWLPYLTGIQFAKNSQWNEKHGATPDQIMTRFEADKLEDKQYLKNLTKNQTEKYKASLVSYKDNLVCSRETRHSTNTNSTEDKNGE